MRFTENEMTRAMEGAAKAVLGARRDVRKGKQDVEDLWRELSTYQRYQLLNGLGDQVLPVLVALPDVEVEAGTRPTFTADQVRQTVEGLVTEGGKLRRAATVQARIALVQAALAAVPPRQDPDALIVPDHL